MRIALIGYGKMGKTIEKIADDRGHQISFTVDQGEEEKIQQISPDNTDVAIEFTQPEAAFDNIKNLLHKKVPVVSGTTGWLDKKPEIEKICEQENGAFFYASNYSIGVNIFFKLNEYLAEVMSHFTEYDVKMEEIHHTEKKDAPSGTAITLAEGILAHLKRKKQWLNEASEAADILPIASKRIDKVPGTHTINYYSLVDNIEIKHTAHSREGFAKGAVAVAEWIKDKKGVLSMNDFLKI
ncbi:MAG: 4-hydroxy-tetrahydrodipicolinate reductase [Cyclobacteriaceae bacterium]